MAVEHFDFICCDFAQQSMLTDEIKAAVVPPSVKSATTPNKAIKQDLCRQSSCCARKYKFINSMAVSDCEIYFCSLKGA